MTSFNQRYVPLDGLRGLAILLVLGMHFGERLPASTRFSAVIPRLAVVGFSGVDLFFVLSGFLITGILCDARDSRRYYSTFYVRRALRIFPLYYLFVVGYIGVMLPWMFPESAEYLKAMLPWYVPFGANVFIAWHDTSVAAPYYTAALWSLGVEEQFYLVWPLFVALTPPGRLASRCLIVAAIAVIVRVALFESGFGWGAAYLMPARMDTLALGAWLAAKVRENGLGALRRLAKRVVLPVGTGLLFAWALNPRLVDSHYSAVRTIGFTVFGLFYAGLIADALSRPSSVSAAIGTNRVMQWFGAYSFGIYIFHNPVRLALDLYRIDPASLIQRGMPWPVALLFFGVLGVGASAGMARLSWLLLEGPINSLKRHFPYGVSPPECALATQSDAGIQFEVVQGGSSTESGRPGRL